MVGVVGRTYEKLKFLQKKGDRRRCSWRLWARRMKTLGLMDLGFLVWQEDERVRKNRFALLKKIADLPKGIADLSVLPGF